MLVTMFMAGALAVGCSSDTTEPGDDENIVRLQDGNLFSPMNRTIQAGESVIWVNDDPGRTHSITPEDPAAWDALVETTTAGEVLEVTFTEPGTYRYRCTFHSADFETGIMRGTITVE